MKSFSLAAVAFFSLLTLTLAEDRKSGDASDLKVLQGEWTVESITRDGKPVDVRGIGLLIEGSRGHSTKDGRPQSNSYLFELDETADPKRMDATLKSPNNDDVVMIGIYKLEGDRLTICRSFGRKSKPPMRPDKLESKTGEGQSLIVLERVTK